MVLVLVLLRFNLEINAAELLEMGDRFDQTLLGHQCRLELENRQRQQRRQEFLDSVPDTKIDCPPRARATKYTCWRCRPSDLPTFIMMNPTKSC